VSKSVSAAETDGPVKVCLGMTLLFMSETYFDSKPTKK
jgi:hypothetical protein